MTKKISIISRYNVHVELSDFKIPETEVLDWGISPPVTESLSMTLSHIFDMKK